MQQKRDCHLPVGLLPFGWWLFLSLWNSMIDQHQRWYWWLFHHGQSSNTHKHQLSKINRILPHSHCNKTLQRMIRLIWFRPALNQIHTKNLISRTIQRHAHLSIWVYHTLDSGIFIGVRLLIFEDKKNLKMTAMPRLM